MKSLLFAYPYCNLGGVATVLKQRLPALTAQGLEVHGLFRLDNGGVEDLKRCGMATATIAGPRFLDAIASASKSNSFDVVTVVDEPDALRVALRFTPHVIYEIHTPIDEVLLKNDPEVLRGCECIIVPSEWSKEWVLSYFPGLDRRRVNVCPNVVDPLPFHRPVGSYPTFASRELLWVGKIAKYKNWREALRIARLLVDQRTIERITLVTGGHTPRESVVEVLTEAANLGIGHAVRWLHNLPYQSMADAYRRAAEAGGVLLSCSLGESFCFVVHESMRAGLPVVASNVGAVSETVLDGDTGFLYELGDYVTAAERIELLLTNAERRNAVTNKALTLLDDRFEPSKLLDLYIRTVTEHSRGGDESAMSFSAIR